MNIKNIFEQTLQERIPLSPPERDIQISEYLFFLYICLVYSYIF